MPGGDKRFPDVAILASSLRLIVGTAPACLPSWYLSRVKLGIGHHDLGLCHEDHTFMDIRRLEAQHEVFDFSLGRCKEIDNAILIHDLLTFTKDLVRAFAGGKSASCAISIIGYIQRERDISQKTYKFLPCDRSWVSWA